MAQRNNGSHQNAVELRGRPVTAHEAALANQYFDLFLGATTLKTILGYYRYICDSVHLKPNCFPQFYPKLRSHLTSWRAKALWKKFDLRANHKCYGKGRMCPNTRVLIIGAGPCGLRTAIEAQLLGAKVVVIEKRDRMSRNNVLHLWPFVIDDLRLLGAKKFFGKFCAGAIDHISIRQLQCILLKAALLLGVEVHTEVSFERLIEPSLADKTGWRAEFKPSEHPVSQYEFDVIIGADGKRNTLQGFTRNEFRGKLAIAITANFINKRTEAEARVEEISGVAFIFNQKFFKDLFEDTGIDLENIVYYKDDTHYFVMTAKKTSLIEKRVIKQDLADTARLLAPDNVDREALMNYAREAAEFSTNYKMLDLEFAVNHYGQPDVAMFDFTSMYAAENASRIIERHGYRLLTILVGDSLLEPFWPTGSGCARGFLSSLDAGWAIRSYGSGMSTPLEVLAERESIYRLLAQTTPENLNKDYKSYTLDPATRYPNLNRSLLMPQQTISFYDTDDPKSIDYRLKTPYTGTALDVPKKRRRRDSHVDIDTLLPWIRDQIKEHEDLKVEDITSSFKDGRVLYALISHYRPDLLDYSSVNAEDPTYNNQVVFDILDRELGIPPVIRAEEMVVSDGPDYVTMISYLTQIYDVFRCEIPHIKHPKLIKNQTPKSKYSIRSKSPEPLLEQLKEKIRKASHTEFIKNPADCKQSELLPIAKDCDDKLEGQNGDFVDQKTKAEPKFKCVEKIIHKNLNAITKNAYMLESKLLQEKIDAALKRKCNRNRSALRRKRFINNFRNVDDLKNVSGDQRVSIIDSIKKSINYEKGVQHFCETGDDKSVQTDVRNEKKEDKAVQESGEEICECCEINKRNMQNPEMSVDILIQNKTQIQLNPITNCVNIIFPRIVETLRYGLGLDRGVPKSKTKGLKCYDDNFGVKKFLSLANMSHQESNTMLQAEHTFDRVVNWISVSDFDIRNGSDSPKASSVQIDGLTDITSVTRQQNKQLNSEIVVEKLTDLMRFNADGSPVICSKNVRDGMGGAGGGVKSASMESINKFLEELKNPERVTTSRMSHCPANKLYEKRIRSRSEPPGIFSVIVENEETELPESLKRVEIPFNKNHPALKHIAAASAGATNNQVTAPTQRPSSRHKRHVAEPSPIQTKTAAAASLDRKKKRKTMEKMSFANVEDRMRRLEEIAQNRCERQSKRRQQRKMQTDQFLKSMQMLQANCKPDHSEPFEDYSLFVYRQTAPNFEDRVKDLEKKFTYIPEKSDRLPSQGKGEKDDDFQARIKGMEDKWRENAMAEKKPKDLLRAIGKIDNSDWNIKEIEKKIIQNKLGKIGNKDKEKVPKWSREQFLARQTKMEKQHIERQDSTGGKFAEIDKNIKILDLRLKEGSVRDLNQQHKVANITEKFVAKEPEAKPIQRQGNKTALIMPIQGNSETCHFCKKRVYFVERLSAEGKFFHRDCFKCQYCHTVLRLGSYQFDRDGRFGFRFYCSQHFGMPGELKPATKVSRKPSQRHKESSRSPEKKMHGVAGVDLLDRVQTPERVSTLSTAKASSDHEESLSQMDEDEWTDRNFGPSTAEISDDDSSSISDTDSDDEEYEEALEEPPTKEGTLKWVERYSRKYMKKSDDSDNYSTDSNCSSYENSSGEDDSDTATEGEEEIRARELRKQEVRVEPPVVHTDTGTDTEIASDDSSTDSSSEVQNSATEISTDSEFAQDDPTPTREVPAIVFNDMFVTKTRGKYIAPKKVQVTSKEIQKTVLSKPQSKDIELKFVPLVQTPIRKPTPQPHLLRSEGGYALNRTQSTGGIATKVSLELKKKYLLGDAPCINSIQKSGSASTLDSKFKSFHSTISDCQKLLKSASQPKESVSPTPSNTVHKGEVPNAEVKKFDPIVSPVVNETEGRPRSPVHETSIIVPQIDWSQQKKQPASISDSTSSSSSGSSSESESNIKKSPSVKAFNNIPRVEIQNIDTKDNIPLDSVDINYTKLESQPSSINESTKASKKTLNQPKVLPKMDNDLILNSVHSVLHDQPKVEDAGSGRSSPSINDDQVTAVLTETELSDWAHDEMGSGELDYELNTDLEIASKPIKKPKEQDVKTNKQESDVPSVKECVTSVLNPGLDLNIEFMDTGTESSDDGLFEVKNNGYVQFHDEEDIAEDSLTPYMVNIAEATNPRIKATFDEDFDDVSSVSRNTGYCVIDSEKNSFGAEVIDLKATDLEKLKEKQQLQEPEDDSLLIVDAAGTTTEENTCSDSTVKNVTEIVPPKEIDVPRETEMNRKLRLEDKLAQVKKDMKKLYEQRKDDQLEFDRHCQRLQSKIDFGNAKDSIDIRKSRRQSKSGSPPKPDLIQEEKDAVPVRTFKQQIEYERDVNKKLVQEMVMNKMKAQNKSLERKRRNRSSFSPSPNRAFELTKSATAEIGKLATPDVLLSTMSPNLLQKSETVSAFSGFATSTPEPKPAPRTKYNQANIRPFSVHTPFLKEGNIITEPSNNTEAFSLPDIHKATSDEFKTPKAPPRLKNEEAKRVVEKLKQDARARARLLSDEDLGLSPEEKLAKLRQRTRRGKENNDVEVHIQDSIESLVVNTERRNSLLYPNSTTKKSNIFRRSKSGEDHFNMCNSKGDRERTKSVSEITRHQLFSIKKINEKDGGDKKCFKSDSNLLESTSQKAAPPVEVDKKKKDRERRKSITKIFTDLFAKKKDPNSGSNKGSFLSRISPKSKDKSKDVIKEGLVRTNSIAEMWRAPTPPPVPPLPANYPENKGLEDSSDCETDWKCADRSSCDTLDQSKDCSMGSLNKRSGRSARKAARQSQLKRHRLAQEIQRKLEETEVKTRELESRGVKVEKALRGESADAERDETDLLKEWFELMRDRMELRRYERELNIRAEEIELEDRHARLQHELKERLDKQGHKTQQDADIDGSIIKEMLDIVNKRDSLTKLLEDDRKRYNSEDRGLEEQMLAKGISLSPISKVAED